MTEQEKQVIAKLQIVQDMSKDDGVKQLARIQIEYIEQVSKGEIGFVESEDADNN